VNPVGHGGRSISSQRVMDVQYFFWLTAVLDVGNQAGITKLSLLIFLFNRTVGSSNGSLSLSVA
jgi:hypothetical protein